MTTTQSGDVTSEGAEAQTDISNDQTSGAVAAGGDGSLSAENSFTATVSDTGEASGETGLSAAEPAPAVTSLDSSGSVQTESNTTATSGDSSATGLTAQNSVTYSSQAAVVVGGESTGDVSIQSSGEVIIEDNGSSTATSGSALANGGAATTQTGAVGTPGPTATLAVSGSAPTPDPTVLLTPASTGTPAVAQGATINNYVTVNMQGTATPLSGTPGALSIEHSATVSLTASASATAVSANACAGPDCPPALATATPSGTLTSATATTSPDPTGTLGSGSTVQNESLTSASTGDATALGLDAQNSVNADANVAIQIGGQNFGVINVVIEFFTRILNIGQAEANSGDAVATGGDATTLLQPSTGGASSSAAPSGVLTNQTEAQAASAGATALGADTSNTVKVGVSESVQVEGDNHNPIRIVVDVAVQLFNTGVAWAQSGWAIATGQPAVADLSSGQSSAAGGYSNSSSALASSGSASATGLRTQNVVDLGADVLIGIEGSNYAPIDVYIRFVTEIVNFGAAEANSGDATSTGAPAMITLAAEPRSDSGSSSSSSSSAASSSSADSSHSSSQTKPSSSLSSAESQASSASGALAVTTTRTGTLSRAASISEGSATSGDGIARAVMSETNISNDQTAAAIGGLANERIATNAAAIRVEAEGKASIRTGDAIVGPTPTPRPAIAASGNGDDTDSDRNDSSDNTQTALGAGPQRPLVAPEHEFLYGSSYRVPMAASGGLPGRDLPPMPGQTLRWPGQPDQPEAISADSLALSADSAAADVVPLDAQAQGGPVARTGGVPFGGALTERPAGPALPSTAALLPSDAQVERLSDGLPRGDQSTADAPDLAALPAAAPREAAGAAQSGTSAADLQPDQGGAGTGWPFGWLLFGLASVASVAGAWYRRVALATLLRQKLGPYARLPW